jgi:aerobic-type carbon monoxide dehydrogenase small subunit (CoxS/CutS family)
MPAVFGVIVAAASRSKKGSSEMPSYDLDINGSVRRVDSSDADKPLLYVLRGLGLTATKFGCGLGQCGACTVLADGAAVQSCQMTIADVQAKAITTLEGLGSASKPHPVQAAFIEHQVPQCGYCTSGMIMSAAALLSRNQKPSEDEIRSALEENLCRRGSHIRVVNAVMAASGQRG